MLWKECMSGEFCKHACLEENFVYLNGKNHALSENVRNNFELYQFELYCLNLKTFSSTFTPVCTLASAVQLNNVAFT